MNQLIVKRGTHGLLLLAVMAMLMAGCAAADIDKTADFKQYKTFGWGESDLQAQNPAYKSSLIDANIKRTVKEEFAKRGITYDPKHPDFLVSYQTYTEQKQKQTGGGYYGYGYPYYGFYRFSPFGFWGMPMMWGGPPPQMRQYTAGTLIIDITDRHTHNLVWRGTVNGDVDNIKTLQKQLTKGVKAIMKKYPVSPADSDQGWKDPKAIS
jgi:hypothetical protein